MKPLWSTAPSWAKWLAMDADGGWCWFECEPKQGNILWITTRGKANEVKSVTEWTATLEPRPEVGG